MTNNYYSNHQDSSISIGGDVSHSTITTGNTHKNKSSELEKTVEEIKELIQQLSSTSVTFNTGERMKVATQVIEKIESNPSWKQKAISAARSGLLATIKTNPIGEIVAAVVEGWCKT